VTAQPEANQEEEDHGLADLATSYSDVPSPSSVGRLNTSIF
jgi:hypothetical protein